jgi:secreted trypsin-like serine protease
MSPTGWLGRSLLGLGFLTSCYSALADPPKIAPRSISPFELQARAVASGKVQSKITGDANTAPKHAYPWVVSLGLKDVPHTIGHFCGAVLIDSEWAISAAHCVTKSVLQGAAIKSDVEDATRMELLTGTNSLSFGGTPKFLDKIIVHPDFRVLATNIPENDIALLHLKTSSDQQTIPLMTDTQADSFFGPDSKVLIAGWGKVSFGNDQPLSNDLLNAFVSVVDRNRCNKADMYDNMVEDTMICAGLGVVDACQGDSGGPAMAYVNGIPLLAGIVSWGAGCGASSYPGVYVRVCRRLGPNSQVIPGLGLD